MIIGYNQRQKDEMNKQNMLLHLNGQYMAEAILATVGNMFSGKTAQKHKYPKKPYEIFKDEMELTEEQLQLQRKLFVMKLQIMQSNFELNHKDS